MSKTLKAFHGDVDILPNFNICSIWAAQNVSNGHFYIPQEKIWLKNMHHTAQSPN